MDTSRNKEEQYSNILSDFLACTGIQDEGQAIQYLENVNWDLLAAINLVMPQHSQRLPSEAANLLANTSSDVEMITLPGDSPVRPLTTFTNPDASIITIAPDDEDISSVSLSSHRHSKQIQFIVLHNKSAVSIGLAETKTVYDLKQEIFTRTGLQVCKQLLKGWPNNELVSNDKVSLASLRLPSVVHLSVDNVASPPSTTNGHTSSSASTSTSSHLNNSKKKRTNDPSDASRLYKLNIADLTNSREYQLKYGGSTKVSAVKKDVADLSKIPTGQQLWTGWWDADESEDEREDRKSQQSEEDRDSLPLYQTGISYPNHDLTVEAAGETLAGPSNNKSVIDVVDTDSSMDEYEDAASFTEEEEDNTVAEILSTRRNLQALIPENIEDETSAVLHFIQQFETRYGAARPHFFPGTLDQAIKEACFQPAKDRKILVVYLHHDASVLSNVFCSQLLCFVSVLEFLTTNCVIWPWDLTHKKNRTRLLASVVSSLGQVAGRLLTAHMDVDRLPLLLLISRLRGATEIFSVMDGNTGVNDLMSSLLGAQEMFSEQMKSEAREESEREERELIKNQQDEAYEQSLAVDRAKEESRRAAEQEELATRRRLESEQMEAAAKKAAHKTALAANMTPEPPAQSSADKPVITVRFRLPALPAAENGSGETPAAVKPSGAKMRRFYAAQPVQDVINFLIVEGYAADEYKSYFGWPRKEISPEISHLSLAELKFAAQETLIVEER